MPTNTKLRRTLALLLAGGSLAIGVPAAIAAGGGDGGTTAPSSGFIQDEQQPRERPGHDCPERGGDDGGSGNEGGSGSDGGSTTTQAL